MALRKKTLHLFVGLPASGKTTFYEQNKALFFKDAIRLSLDDFRRLIGGHQFHKPFEPIVRMWMDVTGMYLLEMGHNLVIDATNIQLGLRLKWLNLAKEYGYGVRCWYFQVSPPVCLKRDEGRADEVGAKVIASMWERFVKPIKGEGYEAVVRVDADGRVKPPKARKE